MSTSRDPEYRITKKEPDRSRKWTAADNGREENAHTEVGMGCESRSRDYGGGRKDRGKRGGEKLWGVM